MAIAALVLTKRNCILLACVILLMAVLVFCSRPQATGKRIVQHRTSVAASLQPSADYRSNSSRLTSCAGAHRTPRNRASSKRTGFVLCLTFREQQTKAATNLYSLQCWAETMLVKIVEPFLQDSRMVVPLDASQEALLRFSDLFDLRQWDKLTTMLGFAPLASWDAFLSDAPRELIVVHLHYSSVQSIQRRITSGEKASHLAFSNAYKEGCARKEEFAERLKYLTERNFNVVREVCINFEHGDELTLFQFNSHIFGPHHPREVTILLDEWRGFTPGDNGKRVLVSDACWTYDSSRLAPYLKPSQQIHCDAQKYREMFLQGSDYIAVIVRTEKIKVGEGLDVHQCLQRTLNTLEVVHSKTQLNRVFLSMDIGKYGSSGTREHDLKDYQHFLTSIYGSGASTELWERSFELVSDVREAGYIAALQKMLVSEARCVVAVGGGSFQRHTLTLHKYASKVKGHSPCVHIVKECSKNMEGSGW